VPNVTWVCGNKNRGNTLKENRKKNERTENEKKIFLEYVSSCQRSLFVLMSVELEMRKVFDQQKTKSCFLHGGQREVSEGSERVKVMLLYFIHLRGEQSPKFSLVIKRGSFEKIRRICLFSVHTHKTHHRGGGKKGRGMKTKLM